MIDDDELIAYFGDVQVHLTGFDLDAIVDDDRFAISQMCVAAGKYVFQTVTGAKRTIFSVRPLEPAELPEEYRKVYTQREETRETRRQAALAEWKVRADISRKAVDAGGPWPRLGVTFEPKLVAAVVLGRDKLEAPALPREWEFYTVTQVFDRRPHAPPLFWSSQRRRETARSIARRRDQAVKFRELADRYPAYAVDGLLAELAPRTSDPESIHNDEGRLSADLDRVAEAAFGKYGIEETDRVRPIPWTQDDRQAIAELLEHLAVEYGAPSNPRGDGDDEDEQGAEADGTEAGPADIAADGVDPQIAELEREIETKEAVHRRLRPGDRRTQIEKELKVLRERLELARKGQAAE